MAAFQKIRIRSYDGKMDKDGVDDLLTRCEVGPMEKFFLFTDNLGDPISRIRNSPVYDMLLAELNDEIVGVIQGTIKLVTIHKSPKEHLAKVGYILGLRVSPLHRRKGIALSLVNQMEKWFKTHQVDYSYMATEKDNEACTNLFINKLGYTKFRTPSILVNPVNNNKNLSRLRLSSKVGILKLNIQQAEFLYRKFVSSTEFFPHDINRILSNKLSLGTWLAYFRADRDQLVLEKDVVKEVPKSNWAMLSVWKSSEVFKLRVGNPTLTCMLYSKISSLIFPCFSSSIVPDLENPFGFLFMYGIYNEGPKSGKLIRALCKMVHNLAKETDDCIKAVVTEVGGRDKIMLRNHIPHWKLLSSPEDLWCIKALKYEEKSLQQHQHLDTDRLMKKAPPETADAIFVDPREV
ncbi:OLC1v1006283C1 [Oldenlandia corymbosa var. corymbosa]|uniref:OLC1v1006283C1 n=1 Tax=Oldenlandia corymbosa var. corymbosa TaxID=529605 RepID=A0AAV1DH51_OLDCO|nr:OLC1v1006283C1 [Oldenlandia corymbosa var. corymbosa]